VAVLLWTFHSFPRAAWECSNGVLRRTSHSHSLIQYQHKITHLTLKRPKEFMHSVPHLAEQRGAWEREKHGVLIIKPIFDIFIYRP
jgi:hypothetical protein